MKLQIILPVIFICYSFLNGCSNTADSSGKLQAPTLYTLNIEQKEVTKSDKIHVIDNRPFVEEGDIYDLSEPWIAQYYPDTNERRLITIGYLKSSFERNMNNLVLNITIPELLSNDIIRAFGGSVPENVVSIDVVVKKMWVSLLRDDKAYLDSLKENTSTSMVKAGATTLTGIGQIVKLLDATNLKFGYKYDIDVTVVKADGTSLVENCSQFSFNNIFSLPEERIYEKGNEMLSGISTCIAQKVPLMLRSVE